MVKRYPCRAERIARLELAATEAHGTDPGLSQRCQFREQPMAYWIDRAKQGDLFIPDADPDQPCECYDG